MDWNRKDHLKKWQVLREDFHVKACAAFDRGDESEYLFYKSMLEAAEHSIIAIVQEIVEDQIDGGTDHESFALGLVGETDRGTRTVD